MALKDEPEYSNLLVEIQRLVFNGPADREEWDNDVIELLLFTAVDWDTWYAIGTPTKRGSDKLYKLILAMVTLGKPKGSVDVAGAIYARLLDWNNWVWDEIDVGEFDDADVEIDNEIYSSDDAYGTDSDGDPLRVGNSY